MDGRVWELLQREGQRQELERVLDCNADSEKFGLTLTREDAQMLLVCRRETLREQKRVEFGEGILPKIIYAFCDSQYIDQEGYPQVLTELQEVFYLYKNESQDLLTDEEILVFMREQFEGICAGSVEYLSDTCLERFARAVRAGYTDYRASGGKGEYSQFSEEVRWERELYLEAVGELVE